jgi:glycosyltransferase involved in cell wall biosynthesis
MPDLFVATTTPTLGTGGAMRTYTLLRALASLGPIDVLYTRFNVAEPAAEIAAIDGLTLHEVVTSRGLRRGAAFAREQVRGAPLGISRGVSPELTAAATALVGDGTARERVIADGPNAIAGLRALVRRRPVIYNAHNLESAFRPQHTRSSAGRYLRWERAVLASAHESWLVSRADLDGARRLAPDARLRYVPNAVDVEAITPVAPIARTRRALFTADHLYAANREALRFLIDAVMPIVWAQLPDATLAVTGRGLELAPGTDARVHALGFVDDLATAYATAACAVVPLLSGGGSPLKFIEALARGVPVVATPKAAAGLDVQAGVHYLEGEGVDGYAAALIAVLRDGADDIAHAGRALARSHYSVAAVVRAITAA